MFPLTRVPFFSSSSFEPQPYYMYTHVCGGICVRLKESRAAMRSPQRALASVGMGLVDSGKSESWGTRAIGAIGGTGFGT